ncbi:MAG: methyltransferase family protein [Candidatus Bruticola sp.]
MKIPDQEKRMEPPFIFKWRGLIMAIVAAIILLVARPTVVSCCCGIVLAILGEVLRSWALGWTGEHTRSQELKASFLVTNGPYKYIRNPLYLGNILTGCGVMTASCGALPLWGCLGIWLLGSLSLYIVYASCIISEEAFLAVRFGNIFFNYKACTPAILPCWRSVPMLVKSFFCSNSAPNNNTCCEEEYFSWKSLRFEYSTWGWLTLVWLFLFVRAIGKLPL